MAEEYLIVQPAEFQRLVQYYKGQITDSTLLNKAGRVAAEEHIIVNNPKVPDAIANQQTRELLQERRRLTKRLRDFPSVPTADLADVESEESAMTEGIVENLLKHMAKKQKKKLQDEIAPLKTPKKEIPTPGTSKIPARIKKRVSPTPVTSSMKKRPPPSNFGSLMDDYRKQLETSFKSIKKGKQPAKVIRKTELDWLREGSGFSWFTNERHYTYNLLYPYGYDIKVSLSITLLSNTKMYCLICLTVLVFFVLVSRTKK